MKIKCGCKINLYLRITGKREDGYHDLDTIFLPLDTPYDILKIKENSKNKEKCKDKSKNSKHPKGLAPKKIIALGKEFKRQSLSTQHEENITVKCETQGIDLKNNTLTKAYALYSEQSGFHPKLSISLKKGIPHGAGLGGGSSNAASLLNYLQSKNPKPLSQKKLLNIATKVGADVPFFLYNLPCHAQGIGEILTPIDLKIYKKTPKENSKKKHENIYLVLISPYEGVNTKEAFENLDLTKKLPKETANKFKKNKLEKKCLTGAPLFGNFQLSCFLKEFHLENDFEDFVFKRYPFIKQIKKEFLKAGAFASVLSGTGSSLFALFDKKEKAKKAIKRMQKIFCVKNDILPLEKKSKNKPNSLEQQELSNKIRLYPPMKII